MKFSFSTNDLHNFTKKHNIYKRYRKKNYKIIQYTQAQNLVNAHYQQGYK